MIMAPNDLREGATDAERREAAKAAKLQAFNNTLAGRRDGRAAPRETTDADRRAAARGAKVRAFDAEVAGVAQPRGRE